MLTPFDVYYKVSMEIDALNKKLDALYVDLIEVKYGIAGTDYMHQRVVQVRMKLAYKMLALEEKMPKYWASEYSEIPF